MLKIESRLEGKCQNQIGHQLSRVIDKLGNK